MTKFKTNIVLAIAAVFVCSFAQAETKVSGFVEAGYNWIDKGTLTGWAKNNAFAVNDAAIYLSHEMDGTTAMVDLDFSWNATVATPGSTTGATTKGSFAMGSKGQAYLTHSYNSGFWWKLGRYDRIWGHEENDAIDRTFINSGVMVANANAAGFGNSTTGLSAGYDFDPVMLEIILGNGANAPYATPNNNGAAQPVFGGKLMFKSDMFHLGATYLRDQSSATSLLDILAGVKLGNFSIDLDANIISTANSQFDIGGWFVYDFTEAWDFAARFEYLSKAGGAANTNAWGAAVGPQYTLNKNSRLRAEFLFGSVSAGTSTSDMGFSLAAEHRL